MEQARRNPPKPSDPSPPRLRRWAASLVLVVACLGTVATSQPRSPSVSSEHAGAPLTLRTTDSRATRQLIVQLSSEERSAHLAMLNMEVELTARWRPADPSNPVTPWLRAQVNVNQERFGEGSFVALEQPGREVRMRVPSGAASCSFDQFCEWTAQIEFELQANAVDGAVDLEWKAVAESHLEGTDELPKGFTMKLLDL